MYDRQRFCVNYFSDLTPVATLCYLSQPVLLTDLQTSTRLPSVLILGRFHGWTGGVSTVSQFSIVVLYNKAYTRVIIFPLFAAQIGGVIIKHSTAQ